MPNRNGTPNSFAVLRSRARTACFVTTALVAGCTSGGGGPAAPMGPGGTMSRPSLATDAATMVPDAVFVPPTEDDGGAPTSVTGGELTGELSGVVELSGEVTVPAGATLTIKAGAWIQAASGSKITVAGTMTVEGSEDLPVRLEGKPDFAGITVSGTLDASFVQIQNGSVCLDGAAGSTITLRDSDIRECQVTLRAANGASQALPHRDAPIQDWYRFFGDLWKEEPSAARAIFDAVRDLDAPEVDDDLLLMSPGELQSLAADGCLVGSHGAGHVRLAGRSRDFVAGDAARIGDLVAQVDKAGARHFAFPFGGAADIDAGGPLFAMEDVAAYLRARVAGGDPSPPEALGADGSPPGAGKRRVRAG